MIRNSLSIFNFNFYKYIKRVVSCILIIAILGMSINILNRIYYEEEPWNHILFKSYYDQENIDNIFIGSSHVFCDVNPFILDKINGMNNFNLATGALTISASYYLLKEASRTYDISNAYVELFYVPNTGYNSANSKSTITSNWRNVTYLKPSLIKYEFAFANIDSSKYIESLIPFVRYRSQLFDGDFINKVKNLKESNNWKNYKYTSESSAGIIEYKEKGFFRSNYTIESANKYLYETEVNLETDGLMPEDNCEYIRKIINFCKDNNINLKFFISPLYETHTLSARNYDSYYQQIHNITQEYNVELYDFNLCKSEYLDIMHQQYFFDNGHMNETGASIFTPVLWNVLSNSEEDNRAYFCNSYTEKISLDSPELYGVYYEQFDDGMHCTLASNRDSDLEYLVQFISEKGNKVNIQNFSDNKTFIIPTNIGAGTLYVKAKLKSTDIIVSSFEISL